MIAAVLSLALCSAPQDVTDTVDLWELNHFCCEQTGKEVFTQHIWWRVETHLVDGKQETDFFVAAWRMSNVVAVIPQRKGSLYVGRFYDPKDKVFRVIQAKQFIETETTVDYESVDRSRLDDSKRSGLRKQ